VFGVWRRLRRMGVAALIFVEVCEWSNHADEGGRGNIGKEGGASAVDDYRVVVREVGYVRVSLVTW
jgi:hypothetical protein